MKEQAKLLKDSINQTIKNAGFLKKTNSWYLHTPDVVLVVNLQKSDFGYKYYINFGVALKEFCDDHFPKENHCHIRFRMEALVDIDQVNTLRSFLDLENTSISDEQRNAEISSLIREKGLPRLNKLSTISGIAELLKSNSLERGFVHKIVREKVFAN